MHLLFWEACGLPLSWGRRIGRATAHRVVKTLKGVTSNPQVRVRGATREDLIDNRVQHIGTGGSGLVDQAHQRRQALGHQRKVGIPGYRPSKTRALVGPRRNLQQRALSPAGLNRG